VHAAGVQRQRTGSSLQQQVAGALARASRAQRDSQALIAECRRASVALRETMDATQREREARAGAAPRRSTPP
jgi:hypothetical protein